MEALRLALGAGHTLPFDRTHRFRGCIFTWVLVVLKADLGLSNLVIGRTTVLLRGKEGLALGDDPLLVPCSMGTRCVQSSVRIGSRRCSAEERPHLGHRGGVFFHFDGADCSCGYGELTQVYDVSQIVHRLVKEEGFA